MLLTGKYCNLMALFYLVKALKIKGSKLKFTRRFLNHLTLYIPDPKNEGWLLSPKQNGSLSKNTHCKRKNSFLPDNYCTNASTKNTDTPECLLDHNIIFSRPKSKA